ncbi:MerR family transcriptional regulator [Halobacillus fulvus]|nr:MerR family transcriptional regulator [Halobacillus fulvus]
MMYKVKEVANLSGVSIRTLHHYDHIGLLSPAEVSESGYRLYGEKEVERLQQILFFKEMEVPLGSIKRILDDPNFDPEEALRQHRTYLVKEKERLERILSSLETTLDSMNGGRVMSDQERLGAFDNRELEEHRQKYEEEVKERWGETDAYKESLKKTSRYSEEDWEAIHKEASAVDSKLADLMDKGPDDPEVQRLIDQKRQHITDYYYTCTPEIFRGLADLYVDDPCFTKNIEKVKRGYASFLREAMHIYCDRLNA